MSSVCLFDNKNYFIYFFLFFYPNFYFYLFIYYQTFHPDILSKKVLIISKFNVEFENLVGLIERTVFIRVFIHLLYVCHRTPFLMIVVCGDCVEYVEREGSENVFRPLLLLKCLNISIIDFEKPKYVEQFLNHLKTCCSRLTRRVVKHKGCYYHLYVKHS